MQGKAGAQSYPVARGTTLPLFDSEGDYVYIKSVDNNGIPLPLVTKVISDPPVEVKAEVVESTPQVDMSEYVTKKSYDEIRHKYDELEARILELETKPTSSFTSTFTGNTFNNTKKEGGSYMRGRSGRMMPMYNYGSYRGDSNGYSRSDNKEMMLEHLQDVADMAVDEKDKKAVERLMSQMISK